MEKSVVAIGHPRCGSGFVNHYLNLLGVKCVHENHKLNLEEHDALSSWAFFIEHQKNDGIYPRYGINGDDWRTQFTFKHRIVYLRNPFDSFKSIIQENKFNWSLNIRRKYVSNTTGREIDGKNELEVAITSYLYIYQMLLDKGLFYFRIEHDLDKLNNFVRENVKDDITIPEKKDIKTNVNHKVRGVVEKAAYADVDPKIMEELNTFCEKYGYPTFEQYFTK